MYVGVLLNRVDLTILATLVYLSAGYAFLLANLELSHISTHVNKSVFKRETLRMHCLHEEINSIGFIEAVHQW